MQVGQVNAPEAAKTAPMLLSLVWGLSSGKNLPRIYPLAFFLSWEKSQVKYEAVECEQMEFLQNQNHLCDDKM